MLICIFGMTEESKNLAKAHSLNRLTAQRDQATNIIRQFILPYLDAVYDSVLRDHMRLILHCCCLSLLGFKEQPFRHK